MRHFAAGLVLLTCVLATVSTRAQDVPDFPKPQKEHEWLQKFVGEWETESKGTPTPGETMECKGTVSARMVGGFWVVAETKATAMGMPMNAMQTIGYDTEKKKYIGTWIDSMFNHLWLYEGSVDAGGNVLTLEAEGPNIAEPGKTAKYRDVYEFKGDDVMTTRSEMLGPDGKWITFMTGTAKRKKK